MTDNEIIKALECCISSSTSLACFKCPMAKNKECNGSNTNVNNLVVEKALDLINRKDAEIERLHTLCKPTETSGYRIENGKVVFYTKILNGYRHEYESLDRVVNDMNIMLQNAYKTDEIAGHYKGKLQTAKAESIKEFAKRLKAVSHPYADTQIVFELQIDNLVKEMVGDK